MHLPDFGAIVSNADKRLVFGPATQALLPLKYSVIYDAYKDQIRNTWTPEEIGLGQDKQDYWELPENIRTQWDIVLSTLTVMDMAVTDAVGEHIMPIASAPEFRAWLARQGFDESLHSDSYAFIIDGLGLNQQEVFDRYLTDASLYAKIQMANIACERLSRRSKEDVFIGYAFFPLVLEGIWFFLGLKCGTYATMFHGKMRGATDQFTYILKDETSHIRVGIEAMRIMIRENPEMWTDEVKETILDIVKEGVEIEISYSQEVYKGLPHLPIAEYAEQVKFRAEQLLGRFGLTLYPDAKSKLNWLSEATELRKESNFFERRSTEYQVGADLGMHEVGGGMPESVLPLQNTIRKFDPEAVVKHSIDNSASPGYQVSFYCPGCGKFAGQVSSESELPQNKDALCEDCEDCTYP